jgi:hypothetical protein
MAEWPTTLEITEAQGMIARFSGFEQLAAAYMPRSHFLPRTLACGELRHWLRGW